MSVLDCCFCQGMLPYILHNCEIFHLPQVFTCDITLPKPDPIFILKILYQMLILRGELSLQSSQMLLVLEISSTSLTSLQSPAPCRQGIYLCW